MRAEARTRLADSLLQTFHENTKLAPATLPLVAPQTPQPSDPSRGEEGRAVIALPPIDAQPLAMSAREAIARRRTVRRYRADDMPLAQLGTFLHFATSPDLFEGESDPSVASMLDLYGFFWGVEGLSEGTYRYDRQRHALVHVADGPLRREIGASIFQQEFATGTGILLLVGDLAAAVEAYGQRGYRYLVMQAGLIGEACYLASTALGIGMSGNGGTRETTVQHYCGLDGINRDLLWTLPFGLPEETKP